MNKREQDRQSRTPEFIILAVATIIVAAIGVLSYLNARNAESWSGELNRSRAVVDLNTQLLSAVKDAETGQRGFLLTGQASYLEPYDQALAAIPPLMERLKLLTQSTPEESGQLKAIEPLIAAKLRELKETIDIRRSSSADKALAIVNTGSGKRLMDDIRTRSAVLSRTADDGLMRSTAATDLSSSRLRFVGTGGSLLLFGFLIVSAITIFRGIDRRDELFRQADENAKKLTVTLTSIADGVISTDAGGRIIFLNPVAERLTGWTQHESAGHHISEVFKIVDETTRENVSNPLEQAIAEGRGVGLANHTKLVDRSGREISIDDSAAPIRNETGEISGAVLVFRDITERRESERKIAQSARELQRSNEELQEFAYAASHDLQSPLRSVKLMAEAIAHRFGAQLGQEGSEMIGYINGGAERMARLIDDLLMLAKATHIEPDPYAAASVQEAFDGVCHSLSAEIRATEATITCSSLPVVASHQTHITVVLQNILANSLKYRGQQAPIIHVSAEENNGEWIISVKDNGIGIDPKYFERIFQPFKRLHGQEYEGTGLGLWTCRKIVSEYGGRLWVESEIGRGSVFSFSLPGAAPSLPVAAPAAAEAISSGIA